MPQVTAKAITPGAAGTLLGRRILGDSCWALAGQVGSGIVLLLGTRFITELVSPAVYGQVALMVGLVAIAVSVFAYPFVSAGMRLLPEALRRGREPALRRVLSVLAWRSTAVALLAMGLGGAAYSYFGGVDPWLFAAAGLLLLATVRRELGIHLLIAERRQREASLWQTSDSLLRPVFAIGLVALGGAKAALVLAGYGLASLASAAIRTLPYRGAARTKPRFSPAVAGSLSKEVLAYAWPLIPMELLASFNSLGDRYVIGYLMTPADVGIYAAAYTLVNEAFHRANMVLHRTFQPIYFGEISRHGNHRGMRVFAIWLVCLLGLGAAGILALVFLKEWVAQILLATEYHSAAPLMPIIGAGCALQALGTLMAQPLYARKQTRVLPWGRLAGALTALIALPLMVQWRGILGAALAAPIYFGVEALVLAWLAKPWIDLGVGWARPRDARVPKTIPRVVTCRKGRDLPFE